MYVLGIPPAEGSNICQSVQVLVPESKGIETKWTRNALEGATKSETVHGHFQNSNWSTNFPIIVFGLRILLLGICKYRYIYIQFVCDLSIFASSLYQI